MRKGTHHRRESRELIAASLRRRSAAQREVDDLLARLQVEVELIPDSREDPHYVPALERCLKLALAAGHASQVASSSGGRALRGVQELTAPAPEEPAPAARLPMTVTDPGHDVLAGLTSPYLPPDGEADRVRLSPTFRPVPQDPKRHELEERLRDLREEERRIRRELDRA